jgi:hypothetical protein
MVQTGTTLIGRFWTFSRDFSIEYFFNVLYKFYEVSKVVNFPLSSFRRKPEFKEYNYYEKVLKMTGLKSIKPFLKKGGLLFFSMALIALYSCGDDPKSGSGSFDSKWIVKVQPAFTTLAAVESNTTQVVVTVTDRNGLPPDIQSNGSITTVNFSTNLGSIDPNVTLDASGHAVAFYKASSTPGIATVMATYQGSIGSATITLISSKI